MGSPTFLPLDEPTYGVAEQVTPLIRRLVANNPSKYTYRGTGTYLIGSGDVVVIDPGPTLDAHRDALKRALEGERVAAVLVTHCHSDHSPLAAWMSDTYGAPTIGFGPHPVDEPAGPDATPEDDEIEAVKAEAERSSDSDEHRESIDHDFTPDIAAGDGDLVVELPGITMRAIHTPGHTSNHLCFSLDEERALFTGDHIMGWSTTVVSPPDGDMADYLTSLAKVLERDDEMLWPTHGPPRDDPQPFVRDLLDHRRRRDDQIVEVLSDGATPISAIVERLYADVDPKLHFPARRSVWAHLVTMVNDGRAVVVDGERPDLRSTYALG